MASISVTHAPRQTTEPVFRQNDGWTQNLGPGSTRHCSEPFHDPSGSRQLEGDWRTNGEWIANTFVQVGTDFVSPPEQMFLRFPSGATGGKDIGRMAIDSKRTSSGTLYIGLHFYSYSWTNHSSGWQPLLWWGEAGAPGNCEQFCLNLNASNLVEIVAKYGQDYAGQPGGANPTRVIPNAGASESRIRSTSIRSSNLVEILAEPSTGGTANGRIRVWVNGLAELDFSNVRWAPSGSSRFAGYGFHPVWGTTGETIPSNQDIILINLLIEGTG